MKFVQIKIGTATQWRLVLSTPEEVLQYHKLDVEENFRAYLHAQSETPVSGTRAYQAHQMVQIGISSLREGESKSPVIMLAELQDLKTKGMLKALTVGEICVNQMGGYCFLTGFLEQHQGVILQTLHKDDLGFPNEARPVAADLIILENDAEVDPAFLQELKTRQILTDQTRTLTFTQLKLQDREYVFKCLVLTPALAFQTQVMDLEQVTAFMQVLLGLPRKKIWIKTFSPEVLQAQPNYQLLLTQHQVEFI